MRPLHLIIPLAVALGASAAPYTAFAQVGIDVSVTVAPPELPVYEQPPLPAPGYIFMPGYWAYGDAGYYWVPGTWVEPPQPGLLWTPGYWGWNSGHYIFNNGYWGPTVGFYGGINYGFGYGGFGYEGGFWRGGVFNYNRAVNNFGGVHVTNVYVKNVTNVTVNHVSYNGGQGGIQRRPTPEQVAYAHQSHVPPTPMQVQHIQAAQQNRALLASANHGHPAILATPRPADFHAAAARAPEAQPHAAEPAIAPHEVNRPGVASPHPVNRTAVPHPVNREAAPESSLAPRTEAARPMAAPHPIAAKPMEPHQMAPRPMEPRPMAAPHPMEARPMAQPHPAAASHPAPAPHPAPAGHEDKPQR